MPIYEYVCHDCGAQYEVVRPIKDADAPINCKKCESTNTARGISVFFAQSGGKVLAGSSTGCAGCSSTTGCSTCGH